MPIDVVNGLRSSLRTAGEHDGELPHHLVPLERAYLAVSLDLTLPDGVTSLGDLQLDPAENVEERVEQRMEAQALAELLADLDRKSTRLNSSNYCASCMPSSA